MAGCKRRGGRTVSDTDPRQDETVPSVCRSLHRPPAGGCCLYIERMARPPREWIEGSIYHVFSRGSNRQAIFLNEGDYVEFDMLLAAAIRKHPARELRLVTHAEPLARDLPLPGRRALAVHATPEPPVRAAVRPTLGSNSARLRQPLRRRAAEDGGAVSLDAALRRHATLSMQVSARRRSTLDGRAFAATAGLVRAPSTCAWERSSSTSDTIPPTLGSATSTSSSDQPHGASRTRRSTSASRGGDARGDRRLTELSRPVERLAQTRHALRLTGIGV